MKQFICIFMTFAICFSLASCSLSDDITETRVNEETSVTTTLPVPVIEQSTHSEKFTDANGRVVYTVDVIVPHLEEFENEVLRDNVNSLSLEIFNEACEKAQSNIENAASFMDSKGSDTPWARKIDFEVSFSNGRYLSFIIKEYFSMLGGENEPSFTSATYDVITGHPCYLTDFAREVFSAEEVKRIIVDNHLCPKVSSKFYNNMELTEEDRQLVYDVFDFENYYLTPDGIDFYMSNYVFNPALTGNFICSFTRADIAEVLVIPE